METILQTKVLTKRFGGLVAVDNVHLTLTDGEIRGLIGPNGSGKTTFINLASGVYLPTQGEISFQGENITGLRPNFIAMKGLLRTFQVPKLFGNMTVMENLLIPHFARAPLTSGGDRRKATERAEELLTLTEVRGLQDKPAFAESILANREHLDPERIEQEVLEAAERLLGDYPEIGAFVFECHNLAPYGKAVSRATGKPIFDVISLAEWVYRAVVKREFPRVQ